MVPHHFSDCSGLYGIVLFLVSFGMDNFYILYFFEMLPPTFYFHNFYPFFSVHFERVLSFFYFFLLLIFFSMAPIYSSSTFSTNTILAQLFSLGSVQCDMYLFNTENIAIMLLLLLSGSGLIKTKTL